MENDDQNTWRKERWIGQFLFFKSALSTNSQKMYERWLERWVLFCCEKWRLNPEEIDYNTCHRIIYGTNVLEVPIRQDVVQEFLNTFEGNARETARRVLYNYFKWLVDAGIIDKNPVNKPKLTIKPFRELGFSIEEINNLFDQIRNEPIQIRAPLSLQFAAGLRVGELRHLQLDDLECDNGNWVIYTRRVEALKGKVAWRHPLPDIGSLIEQYKKYRGSFSLDHDFFFVNFKGRPLKSAEVNKMLEDVWCKTLLPKKPTSHDLRRAFATIHKHALDNPDLFVRLLRHDNISQSLAYPKEPDPSAVREALDKLEIRNIVERFAQQRIGE